jgi:hypothetical protein
MAAGEPGEPGVPGVTGPYDDYDPSNLDLACFLARQHKASPLVFWRAEDWGAMHAVTAVRLSETHVSIRTQPIGRGFLAP